MKLPEVAARWIVAGYLAVALGVTLGTVVAGCGEDRGEEPCVGLEPTVTGEGIVVADDCGRVLVTLRPVVKVDGAWRGGGEDGACSASAGVVACPAGDAGEVSVTVEGGTEPALVVSFAASRDATLQGLALEGEGVVPGADTWLSNGFQSWSQSGVLVLADLPSDTATERALAERGDSESLRTGVELSWWYTYVGGGGPALFAGALEARRFRPWVQVGRASGGAGDEVRLRLVSGASGEEVAVASGQTVDGEPWWVEAAGDLEDVMSRYGHALPSRRWTEGVRADAGWNSWYDLWDDVDEQGVRDNAPLAAAILEPHLSGDEPPLPGDAPPLRIVVDDGWQVAWGEWEPNAKFPSGLDGLAADLHGQGYEVGVWLAPLLVTQDSSTVADHPDWFLPDTDVYNHSANGPMRVVDVTHPGAAAHLSHFIARIVSWGYDFLKIDFLFAGAWEAPRFERVTGMEAYHRALELIRDAAGPDTILLAVGAPPLPSFPHVDAWRVGPDIAFEPIGPSWYFAVSQARTIAARWPLCFATLCDADPVILRDLDADEVAFGGWVVAFGGGGLFLSDDLRHVDASRGDWGLDTVRAAAATGGVPAIPTDHFPADPPTYLTTHMMDHLAGDNRHVLPSRWRLPNGHQVVLNLTDDPLTLDTLTIQPRGAAVVD